MNLANLQLNKQKKIFVVIIFILVAFVDYNYILKAQQSGISKLNPKITKLKMDLVNLNQGLEKMRAAKTQPGAPGQNKLMRSSRILAEGQISELLQEISTEANKLDIKIYQMRPVYQAQKEKSAVGLDKLNAMLINLEMTCDYHSLGRFIQNLENSSVFIGVSELEVSTQLPDYMKQKVSLVLKTYVTK